MDKVLQVKDISLIFFMSIFPIIFYTDASKQKADILKDNNKKNLEYIDEFISHPVKLIEVLL